MSIDWKISRPLFHSFDYKHSSLSEIILGAIFILIQKRVVFCVKGIDGVEQTGQMIVYTSPPYKRAAVGVRFYLCPVDAELLQRNESFLLQAAHKLVVPFIRNLAGQFFSFKIIKSIPLRLLPFG